jgi:hypothetical protein
MAMNCDALLARGAWKSSPAGHGAAGSVGGGASVGVLRQERMAFVDITAQEDGIVQAHEDVTLRPIFVSMSPEREREGGTASARLLVSPFGVAAHLLQHVLIHRHLSVCPVQIFKFYRRESQREGGSLFI